MCLLKGPETIKLHCSLLRTNGCTEAGDARTNKLEWRGALAGGFVSQQPQGQPLNSALPWIDFWFELNPINACCGVRSMFCALCCHVLILHFFLHFLWSLEEGWVTSTMFSWAKDLLVMNITWVVLRWKIEGKKRLTVETFFFPRCFHFFCSGDYCAIYSLCWKYSTLCWKYRKVCLLDFSYLTLYYLKTGKHK